MPFWVGYGKTTKESQITHMTWCEYVHARSVRASIEEMRLKICVAAVVHNILDKGLQAKKLHPEAVDCFIQRLRSEPTGSVCNEVADWDKVWPDVDPEDPLSYFAETWAWCAYLIEESKQRLDPAMPLEAKWLQAMTSVSRAISIVAETDAELSEFVEAQQRVREVAEQAVEGARTNQRKIKTNTKAALESVDFKKNWSFQHYDVTRFPEKAMEDCKKFASDAALHEDVSPADVGGLLIVDLAAYTTLRRKLLRSLNSWIGGVGIMPTIVCYTEHARQVKAGGADLQSPQKTERQDDAGGKSDVSDESSKEEETGWEQAPLPNLGCKPAKIRRTDATEYAQLARDLKTIDDVLCLAALETRYPVKCTLRQGPIANAVCEYKIRPCCVLVPSISVVKPWWEVWGFLKKREVTTAWDEEGIHCSKKAAQAVAAPLGEARFVTRQHTQQSVSWQKGVSGWKPVLQDALRAMERAGKKVAVIYALGDAGDIPLSIFQIQQESAAAMKLSVYTAVVEVREAYKVISQARFTDAAFREYNSGRLLIPGHKPVPAAAKVEGVTIEAEMRRATEDLNSRFRRVFVQLDASGKQASAHVVCVSNLDVDLAKDPASAEKYPWRGLSGPRAATTPNSPSQQRRSIFL